jgi:DNA-binding MarR family transcriptional regulator
MVAQRLSRLQKRILRWLVAEAQRTQGSTASSHQERVEEVRGDKGNITRSLQTLEVREWIVIGRTRGGKAEYLYLTPKGHEKASEI